ncbi:MAG: hypothetical protein ABI273_04080 [Lacunisphaera sp.]
MNPNGFLLQSISDDCKNCGFSPWLNNTDRRKKMETFQFVMTFALLGCVIGCAVSYKKKAVVAGRLGVAVIALGALAFAIQVFAFALTKQGAERLVLIAIALLASPAVGYYWLRIWQRKRPDALS